MENSIRIGHWVINLTNVAYVTYENQKLYIHFCAPKGEQSMFLTLDGKGARVVWEYFSKNVPVAFD